MIKDALISKCGQYRYWLKRQWKDGPTMVFVMLNPSTADADVDDPTIRRIMNFAAREGCGSITVLNLFAFRATDPMALYRAADPVGPENDEWLSRIFREACDNDWRIVGGWGRHGWLNGRNDEVTSMIAATGCTLWCLGQNNDCSPKHPLYLAADTPLVQLL